MNNDTTTTHRLTWTYADAVEKMRKTARLSQGELAAASGLSRSTISNYERSIETPPNFETVKRIARACGFHNDDDILHVLWEDARRSGCLYGGHPPNLFDFLPDFDEFGRWAS